MTLLTAGRGGTQPARPIDSGRVGGSIAEMGAGMAEGVGDVLVA